MQPNPKPRLERLLRHLDTTPNALAKRLGMSQSYLSRILDGTRGNGPHGPVLLVQKAHAKLGLSPRYWSDTAARDPGEYMGGRTATAAAAWGGRGVVRARISAAARGARRNSPVVRV